MEINRADMKLLTECGYSGILRNIDADLTPIFEALDIWMPDQSAGPIGLALQAMVDGDFRKADDILSALLSTRRKGRNEARAILAMCKALQKDTGSAEQLASDLRGTGGSAEAFATLMVRNEAHGMQGPDQATAKAAAG